MPCSPFDYNPEKLIPDKTSTQEIYAATFKSKDFRLQSLLGYDQAAWQPSARMVPYFMPPSALTVIFTNSLHEYAQQSAKGAQQSAKRSISISKVSNVKL